MLQFKSSKPRPVEIGRFTLSSCPVRLRKTAELCLRTIEAAFGDYAATGDVTADEYLQVGQRPKASILIYDEDDLIVTPVTPVGVRRNADGVLGKVGALSYRRDSAMRPWRRAIELYEIHVLAMRDRFPKAAIIHEYCQHVWPAAVAGVSMHFHDADEVSEWSDKEYAIRTRVDDIEQAHVIRDTRDVLSTDDFDPWNEIFQDIAVGLRDIRDHYEDPRLSKLVTVVRSSGTDAGLVLS